MGKFAYRQVNAAPNNAEIFFAYVVCDPTGSLPSHWRRGLTQLAEHEYHGQIWPCRYFSASTWSPQETLPPGMAQWKHCNVALDRSQREQWQRRLWWLRPKGHPDGDWGYSDRAAATLDTLMQEFRPDWVIFEEVWTYRYLQVVQRYPCSVVLDQYNVEADLFCQKLRIDRTRRSRLRGLVQLPQLQRIERNFIQRADRVWVCSQEDTQLLKRLYGPQAQSYVVPNGVNVDHYAEVRSGHCPLPQGLRGDRRYLLFLGQLSYEPNTVAARLLLDAIYPPLKQRYPDLCLLLVGRNPTAFMLQAAEHDPDIVVTGSVADVRPYLAMASIMAVPLQQGGGTRLKILEAFAIRLS
ncbi:MAG: glycosyltransferase, partial [Chloroflexaceae bacterium]|nr:glycosyltransferase [Chloroflexaceae bacterium]